jgi:hypothetical protein
MPSTSASPPVPSLKEQLVRESCAMARRLVTNGIRVPAGLIQAADQFEAALERQKNIDMVALASTHERLARLVSPAKPGTLYLLDVNFHQKGIGGGSLGPVKLVRDMVRVAMVCVGVFIALSVVELVDAHQAIDVFGVEGAARLSADDHRMLVVKIILERVFWLSAAGIGASFAMLFQLNDLVVSRTYDPDEAASYWVKFFLGLVAGFILVALVPVNAGSATQGATTGAQALGPPTVALLGGFSASAVYRILTRMVEALESVFTGGAKEQAAMAEKSALARSAEETSQGRMAVAGQLVDLQQQMAAGMSAQEASAQLKQVVSSLVPSAVEFQNPPPIVVAVDAPAAQPDRIPALAVVSAPEDGSADPGEADAGAPAADAQPQESTAAAG